MTLVVIAALACAFAVAPAGALADDCGEYGCVNIPEPGDDGSDPSVDTSGGGTAEQPTTPATTPTTTPETTTPAEPTTEADTGDSDGDDSGAAGGGKGDDKNDGAGASKSGEQQKLTTSDAAPVASKSPSDDGGGGVPVLLIAIAALAGVGAGFAAWRIRRDSGNSGGSGLNRTAEISRGA